MRFPDNPPTRKNMDYIGELTEYVQTLAEELGEPAPGPFPPPDNRREAAQTITKLELAKIKLDQLYEDRQKAAAKPTPDTPPEPAAAQKKRFGCGSLILIGLPLIGFGWMLATTVQRIFI